MTTTHHMPPWPGEPLPCCGLRVSPLEAGVAVTANPNLVTCVGGATRAPRLQQPEALTNEERWRMQQAARCATVVYPGPAGQVLANELGTWVEFGYRLGPRSMIMRLVDDILDKAAALTNDQP